MNKKNNKYTLCVIVCAIVFIICVFASMCIGRFNVSVKDVFRALLGMEGISSQIKTVILNIRLPRIAAACAIGVALSVSGAVYQGLFNNPMAAPDILGASAGAGFGAALGITLSLSYAGITAISFLFGLAAVLLAFSAASQFKVNTTLGLILAGVVIASLFSAMTSYLKLIADPTGKLPSITYWLMGSLASIKSADILFLMSATLIGTVPLFAISSRLDAIALGDKEARSLGVNTTAVRITAIGCTTLITSVSVAFSGIIGWIGLIMPHIARRFTGDTFGRLLPVSSLIGASFLLITDTIARTASTSEIPIGILTSVIGAPFFLVYILKKGGNIR